MKKHRDHPQSRSEFPEDRSRRMRPLFFISLGAAVLSGGWLMLYGLLSLLAHSLSVGLSSGEAASIGIIGGADGPTAIFIAGTATQGGRFDWDIGIMAAIFAVSVIGLLCFRRPGRK